MSDIREIENFLNIIKEAAKSGIFISRDMVYSNLIRYGRKVKNNKRIDDNFDDWINTFRKVSDIKVFVAENWKYFCQFVNDDYHRIHPYNMIKMYIPIDDEHINEAAKRIFNFMAKNKMVHQSKIGSEVRFDDIVIRIDSVENATKIENFVMHDEYIMAGMMKPNPFAYNNGYISYAWDGDLSFNKIVSSYISNYINRLKAINRLDQVSYKDFTIYLNKMYESVFIKGQNVDAYLAEFDPKSQGSFDNYEKVTRLLLNSVMPDKKMNGFYQLYENIINGNDYDVKIATSDEFSNITTDSHQPQDIDISMYQNEWNNIYDYLVSKYGVSEADQRVFKFIETKNYNYFTKEKNVRSYLINNHLTPMMIQKLYLSMPKQAQKREILFEATSDTFDKYGYTQASVALAKATVGDYQHFTNSNNGRSNMKKYIQPEEVYGLVVSKCLENGINVKDISEDKMYYEYIDLICEQQKNKYQK